MAFKDSGTRITCVPGANSAPGLVILHDSQATHTAIIATGSTNYFARAGALAATEGDVEAQESRRKRYEAIVGQVQAGRGRANTSATDVGAALIAIGSAGVGTGRLAVDDDASGGPELKPV